MVTLKRKKIKTMKSNCEERGGNYECVGPLHRNYNIKKVSSAAVAMNGQGKEK